MAYSSGTFSLLVAYNPVVSGTTISSTAFNTTMTDVATGLSTAMLKDGTQVATASIPFAQGISVGTNWVIDASGNLAVTTNKFVVTASSGNTTVGGTLGVTGATTLSAALTYGGVTLSNAVTGTGNMVLSASPTFTGTITAATIGAFTLGGTVSGGGNQINNVIIGTVTPLAGAFTTLSATTSLAINTNKFTVDSSGNTVVAGTLGVTGQLTATWSTDAAATVLILTNSAATATNQFGISVVLTGDPNDATRYFARGVGNATERWTIRSNGGFANYSANDVNLSDISVKEAIEPLEPSWAKVQAVRQSIQYFQYADATNKAEASSWCCSPMAQDVQAHFPEYVVPFSEDKLGVREQPLIWELMGNLIDEVATLKAKVGL